MSNRKNESELPFNSTSSNDFNKLYNKNTENTITYECSNNDFFTDIDPDLNYINHTNKKCSYYTINEFNKDYFNYNKRKNNLSLFHTNIRSSSPNKINDLKCYLSTLNIDFSIIGLSENWGRQDTIDLYVKNGIQYKLRKNFKNNENLFESVFIEIDKNEFGSNKNIIIGVIYKPPNTSVKHFNEKLEKYLVSFKKKRNMHIYSEILMFALNKK